MTPKSCTAPGILVSKRTQLSRGTLAYRVCCEQARSTRYRADVPATLDDVDGVNVVGVDDTGTTKSSHELGEDICGNLTPGEVPERRERDGHRRVNVTPRYT